MLILPFLPVDTFKTFFLFRTLLSTVKIPEGSQEWKLKMTTTRVKENEEKKGMKRRKKTKRERRNEKKEGMKGESYTFLILSTMKWCVTHFTLTVVERTILWTRKDDILRWKKWYTFENDLRNCYFVASLSLSPSFLFFPLALSSFHFLSPSIFN